MTKPTNTSPHSKLLPAICGLLLTALLASAAVAQTAAEDVGEMLERTEDLLRAVGEIVRESDSEQARRIYRDAVAKQVQARQLYDAERPVFAANITLKARDIARQAERLARGSQNYGERARQYLERLADLHQEVKARAHEADDDRALRFVHNAERLTVQARAQYQQTHYEAAFRLLQQAEKSLKRAARLLFDEGDADRFERELDRTASLIATARERLDDGGDEALYASLERADEALQEARDALQAGEPLRALRRERIARQLAQRVIRQTGAAPGAETVARELERFREQQADLAELAAEQRHAAAAQSLVRAEELIEQARAADRDGRADEALRLIRSALNLQRRASGLLR